MSILKEIHRVDGTLPFDPKTDEYNCFILELTPDQAQYILDYRNEDNRKISKSQVTRIERSIQNDNWLLDGQPITFNVEGNLTEGQHRLSAIARTKDRDKTYKVIIVTGVAKDTFSRTATNKKRNPIDEIQRKYSKAHNLEVSILGDLLKRMKVARLSMQNAILNYEDWVKNIQNSIRKTGDFEHVLDKFSLQRKTVGAWMTLCERFGYTEECRTVLDLLDDELDVTNTNDVLRLPNQFLAYWNNAAVDLSNEKRMDVFYAMLCLATDRVMEREDGMISFIPDEETFTSLEHYDMVKHCETYRRFLG